MKYLLKEWEIMFTDANSGKDGYADELSIDRINKRYILDIDVCDNCLFPDAKTSNELLLHQSYVSKLKFVQTLNMLKNENYTELR